MNRRIFGIGLLLAPVNFLYFLIHVRLDPNLHHDGIVLASAIANSEYLVPNRDFFTQYGPVASEISGIWLRITSPTLLQLRVLHIVILIFTGLCMYWFVALRISVAVGAAIWILWTVTAPFYILPVATPWPSVILNLLLTVVIVIFCSNRKSEIVPSSFYITSLLLTLATFLRLQSIASVVLIALVLLIYRKKRELLFVFAGFCTGGFLAVIYFSFTKSFSAWFQDCVSWAFANYATPRTFDKAWIVDTSLWLLFPAITVFWFLLARVYKRDVRNIRVFSFFVLCFFTLYFAITNEVAHKSYLNPEYFLQSAAQNWLNWLGYVSATTLVSVSVVLVRKKQVTFSQAVILVLGLSSLIQLYPAHDAFHLWWITPVLIITLVGVSRERINLRAKEIRFISCLTIVVSLLVQIPYLLIPRQNFDSSVLAGMRGNPQLVRVVDKTAKMLSSVPEQSHINFDCIDGLYSVINQDFKAKNANMVSWGVSRDFSETNIRYHFTCYTTEEVERFYLNNSFKPVAKVKIDEFTSNILWIK